MHGGRAMLRGHGKSRGIRFGWLFALGAVILAPSISFSAENDDKSISELLEIAENRASYLQERVDAVNQLANLRNVGDVRDQRVVVRLLKLARDKKDNLLLRVPTIQALGKLQFTSFSVDNHALNRYVEPFTSILKDNDEEELIRVEIARVFENTLKFGSLAEERAYDAMIEIAQDTGRDVQSSNTPMIVRLACTRALAAGTRDKKGKYAGRGFEALAGILGQINLEALLREEAIRSFARLLTKVDVGKRQIKPATVAKMVEIVQNKKMNLYVRIESLKALA